MLAVDVQISSFFRYTLMFALKNHFRNAKQARLRPGSQRNLAALFVLNHRSREVLLPAIANHFEFRCQQKQLMLLSYKNCPSFIATVVDFGECGESVLKPRGRILSGTSFHDGVQWPWQAAIFRNSEFTYMYSTWLQTVSQIFILGVLKIVR